MARVILSGNEVNDYNAEGWVIFAGAPTTVTNQPGGKRTPQGNGGKYYFYLNAGTGLNQLVRTFTNTPINECYGRINYWSNASTAKDIIQLRNSSAGVLVGRLRMIDNGSPNVLLQVLSGNGTVLVTSIPSFNTINGSGPPGATPFRRIEWHFKSAASGGIWEVWVDDVLFISNSSLNTSNGATITFDQFLIGQQDQPNQLNYYDDIALNDTSGTVNNGRPGEGVVIALYPVRQGMFAQLTNDYGTNQENADHINKPPTDYLGLINPNGFVGSNSTGLKDSYKLPSLPGEFGGISAVKAMSYCVRNGPALSNVKLLLEPGYPAPLTAPTVAVQAVAGNVDTGAHQYVVTFVGDPAHIGGESLIGPASSVATTSSGNAQVLLTNIPLGPTTQNPSIASARKVYRTKAGAPGVYFLLTTIPDNSTTLFTDNVADASLTSSPPVEVASPNIALPVGAFNWVENIFNTNPNTGNTWTPAEIEAIELGLQFNT